MGKLAHNERIKFRASFLNSIAAGILVAGFALPLLALYSYLPEAEKFADVYQSKDVLAKVLAAAGAMIAAILIAGLLHSKAERELGKLED